MVRFGDSLCPVSSNIQHYLAWATPPRLRLAPSAPRMPLADRKTHRNNLAIRPERYRRLRYIHRIKRDFLDVRTFYFIQRHIPRSPVQVTDADPDAYEQPSIACEGFDVQGFVPSPVKHIEGLGLMWLEDKILRTVQAVLLMIPEYREVVKYYTFTANDIMRDEDHQIFRYFVWERTKDADPTATSNSSGPPVKFILAYQPPWILGPRDIELFADKRLKCLPPCDEFDGTGQQRYNSTHKLWAKLWDVCKMHDCPSFVLTNYTQWVFGGYSKGWENGWTMGVKEAYPSDVTGKSRPDVRRKQSLPRTPSILEYLVFWTVSSMRCPDSFEVPPVPNEISLEMAIDDSLDDSLPPHLLPNHSNFHAPHASQINPEDLEPSESDFSCGSSEVPPSAGVRIGPESDSGQTPPPILNENWRPPVDPVAAGKFTTSVHNWLERTSPLSDVNAPSIPRAPSPVLSEWSDRSLATHQPRRHQGFFNIDTVIIEEVYEYEPGHTDLVQR